VLFPACRQAGLALSFAQAKESAYVITLASFLFLDIMKKKRVQAFRYHFFHLGNYIYLLFALMQKVTKKSSPADASRISRDRAGQRTWKFIKVCEYISSSK
jgi:hypothetical protein